MSVYRDRRPTATSATATCLQWASQLTGTATRNERVSCASVGWASVGDPWTRLSDDPLGAPYDFRAPRTQQAQRLADACRTARLRVCRRARGRGSVGSRLACVGTVAIRSIPRSAVACRMARADSIRRAHSAASLRDDIRRPEVASQPRLAACGAQRRGSGGDS